MPAIRSADSACQGHTVVISSFNYSLSTSYNIM